MKDTISIIIALVGITTIFWFLIIFNSPVDKFARRLKSVPLPEKTGYVNRVKKEANLLKSNGDGCDYRVSIKIKSQLSTSELQEYYDQFTIKSPNLSGIRQFFVSYRTTSQHIEVTPTAPYGEYYLLMVEDFGDFPFQLSPIFYCG
ncbi:MAG: hypothetical protein A2233_01385 [Candidatus Kerfeldbacteria bacterium RIFOXYA2_FULL_38_24]|uniref:Uncharacterized protein n=1 Tax=Candidatus Kerfeldbacteria bacterium RIFOXYB2_FULL_38_14 TaxID=1798547 RepID=A0A1G2BGQ3_9BACT|nr:MAG: hypothetical protein A2233_01385 [Candidatus Kerfeldbacteria bacterium RIFOXYA2_FULL_38_24]OGY87387.1 MAG: hypothetical protein A2319_05475 [Candidatus Kerfeldbacteria bacterium RIFOXYB2_FULL_38_14]OGY90338.1 MAG: hypothetical protein A2458_04380 [Candidatus Kerfeldbacteria bacterium RIFOXYC2_FULL_38_9]